jgi:hypothetical protein
MTGSGVTVERGNELISFDAEVLGVLEDGIFSGVDMILANLESPVVEEFGVWAGKSGSPVYAEDGRLIGSVSYVLAGSPTTIAGITPADAMLGLYDYPSTTAGLRMNQEVALPAAMQRRVVAESDATASQAANGMTPLVLPLAISGVRPGRVAQIAERLGLDGNVRPYAANSAPSGGGSVDEIFPGSNFAAALSYGYLSVAGVGTTTDVCNGTALAFGHPMLFDGRTSLSAHSADAIVIQPDGPPFGSFKVANIGGVVGTVDQDRLLGLRAPLGDGPETTSVRSRIFSPPRNSDVSGQTWVTRDDVVPDLAASHVLSNLDAAIDAFAVEGRVQLTWTARGTRSNGSSWTLTRTNSFADQFDVTFAATGELFSWLSAIETNQFADVNIDDVNATGSVSQTFQRLRFGNVQVAVNNGAFRNIGAIDRLRVRAGDAIKVRVALIKHQEETPSRTVNLRMEVPNRLAGRSVRLAVAGGASLQGETDVFGGTSFNDILARMRRTESNNDLLARLEVSGDAGPQVFVKAEEVLVNVVGGRRTVPVTVAP